MTLENTREPVAVLGATGVVGQTAVRLLSQDSDYYVAELVASPRRAGMKYGEALKSCASMGISGELLDTFLTTAEAIQSRYVISALPARVARIIEPELVASGKLVFSNASAFRMQNNVPILIPELNAAHLSLLDQQKSPGKIVCNSNCVAAILAPVLAPLRACGQITHVSVVTLQAISGAGYPGVSALDISHNIIPHIDGEAVKIVQETRKILGQSGCAADIPMTVHVHRVPVLHGHSITAHVMFSNEVTLESAEKAFLKAIDAHPNLYCLHKSESSPQPRQDLSDDDYRVHVGGLVQGGDPRVIGLRALGHNLVRGAAGAAILNMKALRKRELLCL